MDTAKELQDAGTPPDALYASTWLAPKSTKLGSYCAPDVNDAPKAIRDTYNALRSSSGASVVASIYAAGTPILITMVFAVVVGFLWLKLMQVGACCDESRPRGLWRRVECAVRS